MEKENSNTMFSLAEISYKGCLNHSATIATTVALDMNNNGKKHYCWKIIGRTTKSLMSKVGQEWVSTKISQCWVKVHI